MRSDPRRSFDPRRRCRARNTSPGASAYQWGTPRRPHVFARLAFAPFRQPHIVFPLRHPAQSRHSQPTRGRRGPARPVQQAGAWVLPVSIKKTQSSPSAPIPDADVADAADGRGDSGPKPHAALPGARFEQGAKVLPVAPRSVRFGGPDSRNGAIGSSQQLDGGDLVIVVACATCRFRRG